jgi:hypothetical protein
VLHRDTTIRKKAAEGAVRKRAFTHQIYKITDHDRRRAGLADDPVQNSIEVPHQPLSLKNRLNPRSRALSH